MFFKLEFDAWELRATNLYAVFGLLWVVWELVSHLSRPDDDGNDTESKGKPRELTKLSAADEDVRGLTHTIVNILLFPPLFFFYGLFYTDVLSVFSVLLTYSFYVKNRQILVTVAGLASLACRQTNVFWVGVYLGGMQLQNVLPRGNIEQGFSLEATAWKIMKLSWTHGFVYDPPLKEVNLGGMG